MNATNSALNGTPSGSLNLDNDVDMDGSDSTDERTVSNGMASNGTCHNGLSSEDMECDMDIDIPQQKRQLCGGNPAAIERMLQFGRELQTMSVQLKREYGKNEANKKALQVRKGTHWGLNKMDDSL